MASIKRNFIIDIATPTPRHWTAYRGLTVDGRRGLIDGGVYYRKMNLGIPSFGRSVNVATPLNITLTIGNADNLATDLVFDAANVGCAITITRLTFADTPWDPSIPPVVTTRQVWFDGRIGKPGFKGASVTLDCHADVGRRGKSPTMDSARLMLHHSPPPDGTKISVNVIVGGG